MVIVYQFPRLRFNKVRQDGLFQTFAAISTKVRCADIPDMQALEINVRCPGAPLCYTLWVPVRDALQGHPAFYADQNVVCTTS